MRVVLNAIKNERVRVYIRDVCMYVGKLTYRNGVYTVTTDAPSQITFELKEVDRVIVWSALLPEVHLNRV